MKIRLSQSKLKQIVAESVKKALNEIGDTPKGQFALGAVRGRASARPRYQNNKYGGLNTKSQQDSIANNAADASWEKRKDLDINKSREMNNAEQRGYYYGFNKGMSESVKKREPRKGTIELNGKHIDAVEDGLDKNGNPMYKVNDPSIKGRRCKDGSIRVQHYNFKPTKLSESYGDDAYPQSGFEDFKRIGVNAAYNIYKLLRDNVLNGHYSYLDGECIQRIIDGFEEQLWMLVEHGEFDEYEAKFRHPLGLSKDKYKKDIEDGEYN